MKTDLKKIILGLFIGVFMLAPFSQHFAQRAEAQFFNPFNTALLSVIATNTGFTAGATVGSTIKDTIADAIAWGAINLLIEEMTRQTVNWISGNATGEPQFISDVGGFLTSVGDKVVGEFLQNEFPLVCSPFQLEVRARLTEVFRPERNFQCTLSEAISNTEDFGSFVGGDFFKGGWRGWLSVSRPQNNARGATLAAINSIEAEIAGRADLELAKLDWGQGFISFEQCPDTAIEYCPPEEPGGEYRGANSCERAARVCVGSATINGVNVPIPVKAEIRTPGSVVQTQLNKALGAGQDRLIVADEINELIGALLNRLLSEVLTNPQGLLNTDATNISGGTPVNDICTVYGICDDIPGGGGDGNPPPVGTIFFASNGGDHCDDDQNDTLGLLTDGATARFHVNSDNDATFFIVPWDDFVANPPSGGWSNLLNPDGHPRCQAHGDFGNTPPFSPTLTFLGSQDQDQVFTIPASGGNGYTLGSYGGSGGGNEAFLEVLGGDGGDGGGGGSGGGGGDGSGGPQSKPDFNSTLFRSNVRNVSDARNSLNYRSKLKMERGGAAWWDARGNVLHVRWEEVPGWGEFPDENGGLSFGQLHIIAYVRGRDQWYDWNIEDLQRNRENGGTNDVRVGSSGLSDWVEVVAHEENSPDQNFRLSDGDWFGLYIAAYPGGSVRSDVLPVRYSSSGGSAVGKQNDEGIPGS